MQGPTGTSPYRILRKNEVGLHCRDRSFDLRRKHREEISDQESLVARK